MMQGVFKKPLGCKLDKLPTLKYKKFNSQKFHIHYL
jgi:hypothetical protein